MRVRPITILKAIVYASLVVLALSTIMYLHWLYQSSDVLEFNEQPIPAKVDGGTVILHVDYCKKIDVKGRVRTSFISSSREVFLPAAPDTQPAQCINRDIPIIIPKDLPADTYRVHFRVEYTVNPIKHVIDEADSTKFTVGL